MNLLILEELFVLYQRCDKKVSSGLLRTSLLCQGKFLRRPHHNGEIIPVVSCRREKVEVLGCTFKKLGARGVLIIWKHEDQDLTWGR